MPEIETATLKIKEVLNENSLNTCEGLLRWLSSGNMQRLAQLCTIINLVGASRGSSIASPLIKAVAGSEIPSFEVLNHATANAKAVSDILGLALASLEKAITIASGHQHLLKGENKALQLTASYIARSIAFWKSEQIYDAHEISSFIRAVIQFYEECQRIFRTKDHPFSVDGHELDGLVNAYKRIQKANKDSSYGSLDYSSAHIFEHLHTRRQVTTTNSSPLKDALAPHVLCGWVEMPSSGHPVEFHIPEGLINTIHIIGQTLPIVAHKDLCAFFHSFAAPHMTHDDCSQSSGVENVAKLAVNSQRTFQHVKSRCSQPFQSPSSADMLSKIWGAAFLYAHSMNTSIATARRYAAFYSEKWHYAPLYDFASLASLISSAEMDIKHTSDCFDRVAQALSKVLTHMDDHLKKEENEMDGRSFTENTRLRGVLQALKDDVDNYTSWWTKLVMDMEYLIKRTQGHRHESNLMDEIVNETHRTLEGRLMDYASKVKDVKITSRNLFALPVTQAAQINGQVARLTNDTRSSVKKISAWCAYHSRGLDDVLSKISQETIRWISETVNYATTAGERVFEKILVADLCTRTLEAAAGSKRSEDLLEITSLLLNEFDETIVKLSSVAESYDKKDFDSRIEEMQEDSFSIAGEYRKICREVLSFFDCLYKGHVDWWSEACRNLRSIHDQVAAAIPQVDGVLLNARFIVSEWRALEERFRLYSGKMGDVRKVISRDVRV
ncbi:hypothetical protein CPC08DRAFT_145774 [Agrocybe pediades]|nr:hypothetical protein CPC08DRAFT_145774 [Agrocybe pediades]